MRRPIIAGNWKMNKTSSEAIAFVEELKPLVSNAKCEVIICPSFVCLEQVVDAVRGTNIRVGAQNMHYEEYGAFTGEVSPIMLKESGIEHVIIGHSERRQYFNETDETVNMKIKSALKHQMMPIICCGETLYEREEGLTEKVLARQINKGLEGLNQADAGNMAIAYEPIWAIGTGKTASDSQANEAIRYIRKIISEMYGSKAAEMIRILYGGSVKPSTIKGQMSQPEIDGALVGGASLNALDFAAIVNY